MAEIKTKATGASVQAFIDTIGDMEKREACQKLLDVFAVASGEKPQMWGTAIVGYGSYHYESERSAQKGDWMLTGFSPRKANLTIYIMPGFENYTDTMRNLGKYKTSKSCLYIKHLSDIDVKVLEKLIKRSVDDMRKKYL